MKQDILGEYNENEVPHGLNMPLMVDERNEGIRDAHGNIIANYNANPSHTHRGFMRRAVEFIARLASTEIAMHDGKVYVRHEAKIKDKDLVITFKPA